MDENKGLGPENQGESAPSPKPGAEPGPLGRTQREDQRRRLIVAGLSTTALMTLPSRRVWASKCSKSKLLSGNLSAMKKKGGLKLEDCQDLACGKNDWGSLKKVGGTGGGEGPWVSTTFDSQFQSGLGVPSIFGSGETLHDVVQGKDPDIEVSGHDIDDDVKHALKLAGREITAAYLNATYIHTPGNPDHLFNFDLTVAEVLAVWNSPAMYSGTLPALPSPPKTGSVVLTDHWYSNQTSVLAAALGAALWFSWYKFYKKTTVKDTNGDTLDDGKNHPDAGALAMHAENQFPTIAANIGNLIAPLATENEGTGTYCPFN